MRIWKHKYVGHMVSNPKGQVGNLARPDGGEGFYTNRLGVGGGLAQIILSTVKMNKGKIYLPSSLQE